MAGSGQKTPNKRAQLVEHLLSGETVVSAARLAGVAERTARRWVSEPDFRAQVRQAEGQALDTVSRRLVSMSGQALDALESVLNVPEGRNQNVRRLAAVAVLELLLKWREVVDFEERLAQLERTVNHATQKTIRRTGTNGRT